MASLQFQIVKDSRRYSNLESALRHAAAGLRIIPVRAFQDAKGPWKKKPHIRDWQEKATTDPRTIEQWWSEFPDALPGIELGSADLVVIDADHHNPEEDGVAAFAELRERHSDNVPHPQTLTAGNGQHHFYRQPPGRHFGNGEGSLPKGINVRGAGGFVVAPGAVRPDGAIWESDPQTPDLRDAFREGSIPEVPAWLVEILRPQNRAEFAQPNSKEVACTPRGQENRHTRQRRSKECATKSQRLPQAAETTSSMLPPTGPDGWSPGAGLKVTL
jgi:hypothetical protein